MDLATLWQSVAILRRAELITLIVTMVFPILSGTVLLTIRHRLRTLHAQTSTNQGAYYTDRVENLESRAEQLAEKLKRAQTELSALRPLVSPREITPLQEDILIEKLRGVHGAPVIVAAYAFEEESAAYAAQIAAVLRKAHWDVTINKASMNDFKGISLAKIDLTHQPMAGWREINQAFSDARLDVHQHAISMDTIAGSLQDGSLLVVVGRK